MYHSKTTQKHIKEIIDEAEDLEQRDNFVWMFIGGIVLLCILAGVVFVKEKIGL